MSVQILKEEVAKLSKAEQAELMHFMIALLTGEDFVLSIEWQGELDRREAALDDGSSVGRNVSRDPMSWMKST